MTAHRVLYLDFETYYDKEYSLRNMTPAEYILDPRFEVIMCSVAEGDEPAHVIDAPDLPAYLATFDPAVTTTVTFNSLFDNCILAWKYGFVPSRMLDPMGMARALWGHETASVSLASVCKLLRLPDKGTFIQNMLGKHRADLLRVPGDWRQACEYANGDVTSTRAAFKILLQQFPVAERKIMDRVLRCAVQPRLVIDVDMLKAHLEDVKRDKAALLASCGASKPELMSAVKFCEKLKELNVDIEYKTSATGKTVPALAKTDEFMSELLEHEDDAVRALATARLGMKSTIEETRCERLLSVAGLPWDSAGLPSHSMPVPLRYSGAHTHRLSGDWKLNLQNLPSGRSAPSKLRKSLCAPPGHKLIKIDLSQIEARICAWLCNQWDATQAFANKKDLYSILAMAVFGIDEAELKRRGGKDSLERFIGKSGVLGLGFGCGKDKFYNMVLRAARGMKMDMAKLKAVWTMDLAEKTVQVYRTVNHATVTSWLLLDSHLASAWKTGGKVTFADTVEITRGAVTLPNGMQLRYADPQRHARGDLTYRYGKRTFKMYGSKFLENIVQALARIVIMHAALRLWDRGYHFVLQEHDALLFVVPDADVDNAGKIIYEEVCRRPSWARDLPLAADIGYGLNYGECNPWPKGEK